MKVYSFVINPVLKKKVLMLTVLNTESPVEESYY